MAFFIRLSVSLKKRLLSSYNLEKRDPIQWGITHKSVAYTEYCKEVDISVIPTGNLILRTGFVFHWTKAYAFYKLLVVLYTVQFQILPPSMCTQFYSNECFIMPPYPCKQSLKGDIIFKMSVFVPVVMILFGHIFWGDCNGWISTLIIQSYLLTCICTTFFEQF